MPIPHDECTSISQGEDGSVRITCINDHHAQPVVEVIPDLERGESTLFILTQQEGRLWVECRQCQAGNFCEP